MPRWLDPLCQFVTDKELAKQYIEDVAGPGYVLETYRILRNRGRHKGIRTRPCSLCAETYASERSCPGVSLVWR